MSCNCKNRPEIGRGAAFCNCGEECRATVCEGCFKLHETQWLADYPDHVPTDIFEVRFKNTRRSFYQNVNNLPLETGDIVAVEASPGHDIGIVSLTGDMVAKQMKRTGFNPYNGEFKKIYRKAKPYDIERWQEAIALEHETMIRSRQIAADMGLNMKIGDVEYQGDKIKAIFYYIADERVDFRELIKVFAEQFHIRIEMKQIGARQEAGRIGGLGACGRELCCASWISSFSSVTTNTARMQELSLNPQKLAGHCSKLKCCLAYEYDTYADARRDFPRVKEPLQALDGEYYLVKSDILARTMQFSSSKDALVNVTTLSVERVRRSRRSTVPARRSTGCSPSRTFRPPRRNRPIVRRRTASPVSTASAATTSAVAATGRARRATGRPKALRERRSQPDRKPALWIGDNGVRVPSAIRKKAAVRSAAAVKTVRRRAANGRVGSVAPDVAETAAATVKTAAVKVATATVAASAAGRAAAPIAAAVREMPTVRRRALRGRTAAARAIRSNGPKRDGRGCVRRWTNPPARADS